jgi:hypothetical protein
VILPLPGQKPTLLTSCEYASRDTVCPGPLGCGTTREASHSQVEALRGTPRELILDEAFVLDFRSIVAFVLASAWQGQLSIAEDTRSNGRESAGKIEKAT